MRIQKIESKSMKKLFHADTNQNKFGIAILISDKIILKMKSFKENYFIRIKDSILQKDLRVL